jgi:CheY-like chemotaxis protein
MYRRRVLVVDDLPDVRSTLTRLLVSQGYWVRAAGSLQEAQELLDQERFHVAVLDLCLDRNDTKNEQGLCIARKIKESYPSIVSIMLTGYATVNTVTEALQPDQSGETLVYKYLVKGPDTYTQLAEVVDEAFGSQVRISESLEILDQDEFVCRLCARIRFWDASPPSPEQLAEEADELVRKLFYDCTRVEPDLIQGGYSGVAICKFRPWYPTRGAGETVIAKLGATRLIEGEVENYRRHVHGMVGGHRVPNLLETARTRSLSGVLYTFAGLGASQGFSSYYQQANVAQIEQTLRNLFEKTCFPSRLKSGSHHPSFDLQSFYTELYRLRPENLRTCLDRTMGKRHPFRKDTDGKRIWLGGGVALVNPVEFALTADLPTQSFMCVIHGDLQGYNVIVDGFGEAWLIDFAHTGDGPLIHDYASFENYLRISMVRCQDWQRLYEWNQALFGGGDLHETRLPETLKSYPEIHKAHRSILTVRDLAYKASPDDMQQAYLIGLLFSALKLLTIMNLPRDQRDHALISAALIAERLQHTF